MIVKLDRVFAVAILALTWVMFLRGLGFLAVWVLGALVTFGLTSCLDAEERASKEMQSLMPHIPTPQGYLAMMFVCVFVWPGMLLVIAVAKD